MSKLDTDLTPTGEPEVDAVTETPTSEDLFAELVGEGKRYKTPAELAKAKLEADKFIKKLTDEQAEARAAIADLQTKADRAKALDARIAELQASQPSKQPTAAVIDETVIDERIHAYNAKKKMEENLAAAEDAVIAQHKGDVSLAKKAVSDRAKELGMTTKELLGTGAKNPRLFSELMGIAVKERKDSTSRPDSEIDPNKLANTHTADNPAEGTQKWYSKLRRENPTAYFSKDVQVKMYRDAERLGQDFYK